MTTMGAAHGGDRGRMARMRKPVVDRGTNLAALDRWFAGAMMASDQKEDPVTSRNPLLESAVDRVPRLVDIQTVQVKDTVGFDATARQLPVPAPVQRPLGNREPTRLSRCRTRPWRRSHRTELGFIARLGSGHDRRDGLSR